MNPFYIPEWKPEDARMPTKAERRSLARMLYLAFCDLRMLALEGRSEQARDLAEAMHNVPLLMYSEDFSFRSFRDFIERYQKKHAERLHMDYLKEWEKISAESQAP
jgi:hypothetical protein